MREKKSYKKFYFQNSIFYNVEIVCRRFFDISFGGSLNGRYDY